MSDAAPRTAVANLRKRFATKNLARLCLAVVAVIVAACAATPTGNGDALAALRLFDADHAPRFTFHLSCAGQVAAETDLCWVPSKYFSEWAGDRHIAMKTLPPSAQRPGEFAAAHASGAADFDVVVRFQPIALPSYSSEVDGMGGYVAPKAGFDAELVVYAARDGKPVATLQFHRKSDAKHKEDAVPYVKRGVQEIVAALDPAYKP